MKEAQLQRLAEMTQRAMPDQAMSHDGPSAGDLFVLEGPGDMAVEWLIVDDQPDADGRIITVAVDTCPLAGSTDVVISTDKALGPLTVRRAVELRLDGDLLESRLRTGRLSAEDLRRVRETRQRLASRQAVGTDAESTYQLWIADLERLRDSLQEDRQEDSSPTPWTTIFLPSLGFGSRPQIALAVLAISILAVGLGAWRFTERIAALERRLAKAELAELAEPLVNLPLAMLAPTTSRRGPVRTLQIPASAPFVVVILGLGDAPASPRYRLEVREPDAAEVIWSTSELVRTDVTELSVALPREMVVGDRRLSVFVVDDDEPWAIYDLRVELTRR